MNQHIFHARVIKLAEKEYLCVKHHDTHHILLIENDKNVLETLTDRMADTFSGVNSFFHSSIPLPFPHKITKRDSVMTDTHKCLEKILKSKEATPETLEEYFNGKSNALEVNPEAAAKLEKIASAKNKEVMSRFQVGDYVHVPFTEDYNKVQITNVIRYGTHPEWQYSYDVDISFRDEGYQNILKDNFEQQFLTKASDKLVRHIYEKNKEVMPSF